MAERIDMPFGLWTCVGKRNNVSAGSPNTTNEGEILRVFGPLKSIGFWVLDKMVSCAKTDAPILAVSMSYDVFLHKDMPSGVCDLTAPHLGVKSPNNLVSGMNRHFQAKLVKYQHLHLIKTTVSIRTRFCTVINTTKYSLWMSKHAHNSSKMVDGHHFEKKTEKSLYISNGLTDQQKILHNDAPRPSEPYSQLKILVSKNPRWHMAVIFKHLNSGLTVCHTILYPALIELIL